MNDIETVTDITAAEFEARHLRGGRPLIIRGAASKWPSSEWSIDFLKRRFASREVKIQIFDTPATRLAAWRREKRLLGEYLDAMNTPAGRSEYLVHLVLGRTFPELVADVRLPEFLQPHLRRVRTKVTAADYGMFVGAAGQSTEIHYHPVLWGGASQAIAIAISGRKLFRLFSPADTRRLQPFPLRNNIPKRANWSQLLGEPAQNFPSFADVYLAPGDALFIPVHWWHSTICLDPSISLTLFFRGVFRQRLYPGLVPRDLTVYAALNLARMAERMKGLARSKSVGA